MNETLIRKTLEVMAEEAVPSALDGWSKIQARFLRSPSFETSKRHSIINYKQIAEDAVPDGNIDLWPVINARLTNHPRHPRRLISSRGRAILACMVILTIFLAILVIPQAQAWAQEAFQFFLRTASQTIPLKPEEAKYYKDYYPTPHPSYRIKLVPAVSDFGAIPQGMDATAASLPGCKVNYRSFGCQIAAVEQNLGVTIAVFPNAPNGYAFSTIEIIRMEGNAVRITYAGNQFGSIILWQGKGTKPPSYSDPKNDWSKVPSDQIELVRIAGETGEYVNGAFEIKAGSTVMSWEKDGRQRLAWRKGDAWYLIDEETDPTNPSFLGKDQLLTLASTMKESQNFIESSPDPTHLNSITEAESVSAIQLMRPGLLPEGFKFEYARYDARWKIEHYQ